jgi:hypothetical protein
MGLRLCWVAKTQHRRNCKSTFNCTAHPTIYLYTTRHSRCSMLPPDPFFVCVGLMTSPPALVDLHRLRVPERVRCKVATTVWPLSKRANWHQYSTAALHRTVEVDSRRRLRSADSELLIVQKFRLVTIGDRSLSVVDLMEQSATDDSLDSVVGVFQTSIQNFF